MPYLLIIYSSRYGQTGKIAHRIGFESHALGAYVHAVEVGRPIPLPLEDYAGVIVGTSIYVGKSDSELINWVRKNKNQLRNVPTGLYSVSLNAADTRTEARTTDKRLIQDFINKTGWEPTISKSFAGALRYSQYNPLVRFIMKKISQSAGGPTDTTQDYELTDWSEVSFFLQNFLKIINERSIRQKHLQSEVRPELF